MGGSIRHDSCEKLIWRDTHLDSSLGTTKRGPMSRLEPVSMAERVEHIEQDQCPYFLSTRINKSGL